MSCSFRNVGGETVMIACRVSAVALEAKHSLGFVREAMRLLREKQPILSTKAGEPIPVLSGVKVSDNLSTGNEFGWFRERHEALDSDSPAMIVRTSGTSGPQKRVLLSHGNLATSVNAILERTALTDDVREYVGVPVNYSFGFGRVRAIAAVGGAGFISASAFDPMQFARMLERREVNALSAVPSVLRVLLRFSQSLERIGHHLRWLEIGSQSMTGMEKRQLSKLFPAARIVQHYGLTEASRSTFLDLSEGSQHLDSVGTPSRGSEVDVSASGLIRVRGGHVARLRLQETEQVSLTNAEGWLETLDLGNISQGHLYVSGRADDAINCGGIKVHAEQIERALESALPASWTLTVARIPDAVRGDGVLVVTDAKEHELPIVRVAAGNVLSGMGLTAAGAVHVWRTQNFAVTETGKVSRRRLAEQYLLARDRGDMSGNGVKPAACIKAHE